ncbi:MAG: prepilin-type N-terminal cleavage/methylation domain-containing protein [Candidatus Nanopelagicales bacterium]
MNLYRPRPCERGFTLVELLVVVLVLVVLAAVAVPIYLNQVDKARDASTKTGVATVARFVLSGLSDGTVSGGDGTDTGTLTSTGGTLAKNGVTVYVDSSAKTWCASKVTQSGTYFVASHAKPAATEASGYCTSAGSPPPVYGQNLLTAAQANPTATGAWMQANVTESPPGTYTAATVGTWPYVYTYIPVIPGHTYTLRATITANSLTARVYLYWYNGSTRIGGAGGNGIAAGSSGVSQVTATAPAGATRIQFIAFNPSAQATSVGQGPWTIRNVGFWEGGADAA